jgi:hypothetical protein
MPNHQKPIEECKVWDILDWDRVAALSVDATGDPRETANLWPWLAKKLIDVGAKSDADAEPVLHRIASSVVGYGEPAVRRQKAGIIADKFGADPVRLIDYLAYKWGLFKRR